VIEDIDLTEDGELVFSCYLLNSSNDGITDVESIDVVINPSKKEVKLITFNNDGYIRAVREFNIETLHKETEEFFNQKYKERVSIFLESLTS